MVESKIEVGSVVTYVLNDKRQMVVRSISEGKVICFWEDRLHKEQSREYRIVELRLVSPPQCHPISKGDCVEHVLSKGTKLRVDELDNIHAQCRTYEYNIGERPKVFPLVELILLASPHLAAKVGDLVIQMKTPKKPMVIRELRGTMADCYWEEEDAPKSENFHTSSLFEYQKPQERISSIQHKTA